ncbi:MAG: hypothetical protein WBN88_10050 [Anderseniella sp.]
MSDSSALDTIDGLDYEEIEQAVMETSRGRWFLTEFARRHKAADTAVLLDAIRRLEGQLQSKSAEALAPPETEQPHGHAEPEQADAQASGDSDDGSGYDEIADKLDRTTQLVRRLRSSHKLIGEAADKPLTAPKTVPANSASATATGDVPGFIGSDDDIFADNSAYASEAKQQQDATADEAEAAPDTAVSSPIDGDTLNFTDLEVPDVTAQHDAEDAGDDSAADHSDQQAETAPVSSQADEPSAPPSTVAEDTSAGGRISMNSPTAANQVHTGNETAAGPEQPADQPAAPDTSAAPDDAEPAEKPKKRIIVIRRPADHPGDIPLADSAPDMPGDSPSAA